MVILDRGSTHANCADEHTVLIHDGQAAWESDKAVIRMLNAVKRFARLGYH